MESEQFALFAEEEIPESPVHMGMSREVVSHHLKAWTERSGVTKRMADAVIGAAEEFINTYHPDIEDVLTVFGAAGFALRTKKMSAEEVKEALILAPHYRKAINMLGTWSNRRTLTARSIASSTIAVATALHGKIAEDRLEYALKQRSLLASARVLTIEVIFEAIERVEQDKAAGKLCKEIFDRWFHQYYVGKYTQPVGQILQVLKKALLEGFDPQIVERALILTSSDGFPITETSLQYGIVAANKEVELRERAGAFTAQVGTQKEISARLFNSTESTKNVDDYQGMF